MGIDEGRISRRSKNHTAGRGCVGVQGYIQGGTKEGGEDIQKEEVIHFGSYKTLNGHNGGLESVMRRMDQNSIDLGILQESKINGSIYV